jgi:hypothetical protein
MAKSVRSSVRKRNSAKLRSRVFGPVVDARTERLSAKLQKLAAQPRPSDVKDFVMDVDASTTGIYVFVHQRFFFFFFFIHYLIIFQNAMSP